MDFTLNDEQELLRNGLSRFLATRYDLEKSRSAAKTGEGWQLDIWRAFADELGIRIHKETAYPRDGRWTVPYAP